MVDFLLRSLRPCWYSKVKGKVINSQIAFEDIYKNYLLSAERKGDDIIIEITRKYKNKRGNLQKKRKGNNPFLFYSTLKI